MPEADPEAVSEAPVAVASDSEAEAVAVLPSSEAVPVALEAADSAAEEALSLEPAAPVSWGVPSMVFQ